MSRSNCKNLLPVGLVSLSAGLIVRNFLHTRSSEFAAVLLIGMSILFMNAGVMKRSPSSFK